jgi:hypothetical protein
MRREAADSALARQSETTTYPVDMEIDTKAGRLDLRGLPFFTFQPHDLIFDDG